MNTFQEFQTLTAKVPLSLRNNLNRIHLPLTGLQEEVGQIGSLLMRASVSGRFNLTTEQQGQLRGKLADVLWYVALLCEESGIPMQEVASHSIAQVQERIKQLDPDNR